MEAGVERYQYREVERRIIGMVETGALKPGERVPSLRELGMRLGLSLSTVSQAYAELERQGIIEARPRSGFFVRPDFRRLPTVGTGSEAPAAPRQVKRTALIRQVMEAMGQRCELGPSMVDPALLPAGTLGRLTARVAREDSARSLSYCDAAGVRELRAQIALRLMNHGAQVGPDGLIITSGAMEGLSIALRCLARPGDNILVQSPTYHFFLQLLESLGLRAIEIPSHPETGIDPARVADALDKYEVRACVLTPSFNNPDGSLIPAPAKAEIVSILADKGVPLVEDDIYGELHFDQERPALCSAYDRKGLVLHVSSLSKTLSPGYRIGWLAPGRFMDKALDIKSLTSLCTATPTQLAMAEYLRVGGYDRHLRRLRSAVESQMRAMAMAVSRFFPDGTRLTAPRGGLVLWVELPDGGDGTKLFLDAAARGVGVTPGSIYSTRDKFIRFIRLNCGYRYTETIEAGIRTLGELAARQAG